jgi:hypothetical protein
MFCKFLNPCQIFLNAILDQLLERNYVQKFVILPRLQQTVLKVDVIRPYPVALFEACQ